MAVGQVRRPAARSSSGIAPNRDASASYPRNPVGQRRPRRLAWCRSASFDSVVASEGCDGLAREPSADLLGLAC